MPTLTKSKLSEARRFIILVDTLYDQKARHRERMYHTSSFQCRIVISAEQAVEELFQLEADHARHADISDSLRVLMDDLKIGERTVIITVYPILLMCRTNHKRPSSRDQKRHSHSHVLYHDCMK